MRRIGKLDTSADAARFCDYLITQSIEAKFEEDGEGVDVWIRDEATVDRARQELAEFQANTADGRYDVSEQANKIRLEKVRENQRRLSHQKDIGKSFRTPGRAMGGMSLGGRQQAIPVTITLIALSVLFGLGLNFSNPPMDRSRERFDLSRAGEAYQLLKSGEASLPLQVFNAMSFVDLRAFFESDGDGFASMKQGQLWRLITPMLIHGGTFHLLFNMIMMFQLASMLERVHNSWRLLALVVLTQAAAMLLQAGLPDWLPRELRGSPFAVGASGAVFGLFGFIWIRPKFDGTYPIRISSRNVAILIGWLFVCMTPLIQGIANGAHVGGLLMGMFLAAVCSKKLTG
ncbi:MAG: rhomboid family intramembrane serine protease [Planctomycetota bacterium]